MIPLFPLGNALLPDGVLHLRIFEVRYLDMVKKAIANHTEFGVVPLLAGREIHTPEGQATLAGAGTMARIEEWSAPMPTLLQLRCTGTRRFRLGKTEQSKFGLWVGETTLLSEDSAAPLAPELEPSARALGKLIAQWQRERVPQAQMPLAPPYRLDEAGWVANRWAELLPLSGEVQQTLLLQDDPVQRLRQIQRHLEERGLLS